MILIITSKGDQSVSEIALWLNYYKTAFTRINVEEVGNIVDSLTISNDNTLWELTYKNKKLTLEEIETVWFWHGVLKAHMPYNIATIEDPGIRSSVVQHLNQEYTSLLKILYLSLERKNSLGKYHTYQINKLEALQVATSFNVRIPDTLITTSKQQVAMFKERHNHIITKGIQDIYRKNEDGTVYTHYTEMVSDDVLNAMPDTFYPSLFQEYIHKKYELRIFYLSGNFYASAIFSQLDEMTRTDFRKYNEKNPNRIVPFKLPEEICYKLKKCMNHFDLNTGSIDMVVTPDKQFVFLEINPVGQYGFISDWCNYYLDQRIAQYLKLQTEI